MLLRYYVIKPSILHKNRRYDGYQRVLASMIYTFFDKKTASGAIKNEVMQNKELAEKLYKPIFRKFQK